MVSFEIFVKAMPPSLSELKVLPSFCFPIKIRDDRTASSTYVLSRSVGSMAVKSYFFEFVRLTLMLTLTETNQSNSVGCMYRVSHIEMALMNWL